MTDAGGGIDGALDRLLADVSDDTLATLVADVGGHDLGLILDAYAAAAQERERPSVILAHTIKGWGLPFAGDPLNHTAVTTAAQMDELRPGVRRDARRRVGGVRARHAGGRTTSAALPPLFSAPPAAGADRDPRRDRRDVSRRDLDAGGVRSSPGRARPPAGGRRARDGVGRRGGHHASGRLDEPQGHLLSRRPAGSVRRHAPGAAVAGRSPRPARGDRHRRARSVPAAGRARTHGRAVRPDLAADRHALRSVHHARPRCALPRALLRRALHRGRHAVRRHAVARGRRASVGHHARHRRRAAGHRLLRAGVRARGGVDPAGRTARGGRAARESLSASEHRAGRSAAGAARRRRATARRCSPAATG